MPQVLEFGSFSRVAEVPTVAWRIVWGRIRGKETLLGGMRGGRSMVVATLLRDRRRGCL